MSFVRYDMPAMFGPSLMPEQSLVPQAETVIISFETTRDAAAKLLPRFFEVPDDKPVVTVSRIDYQGVDYLGGRGYREVVLSVSAVFRGAEGAMLGTFAPVMWVTEPGALIGGREYMGYAKLLGEMGSLDSDGGSRRFQCAEYGSLLLEGEATGLKPLSEESLARVNRGATDVRTFGWKYIPGPGGVSPDVDYPLVNSMRWIYQRAWTGEGRLGWHAPTPQAAPLSSRVIAALGALPIKEFRRAFVGEGSAVIDRAATRRLNCVAPEVSGT